MCLQCLGPIRIFTETSSAVLMWLGEETTMINSMMRANCMELHQETITFFLWTFSKVLDFVSLPKTYQYTCRQKVKKFWTTNWHYEWRPRDSYGKRFLVHPHEESLQIIRVERFMIKVTFSWLRPLNFYKHNYTLHEIEQSQ